MFHQIHSIVGVGLVALCLLGAAPASASPITFYTNQAAWNAAVAGLSVGPYQGQVMITDTTITLTKGFPPCDQNGLCVSADILTTTTQTGWTSLHRDLNSFVSDCSVTCSSITDTKVTLATPIMALAATNFSCSQDPLTINGLDIGLAAENVCRGAPPFLGMVFDGPLTSLDFDAGLCCTDGRHSLTLSDIVVATVPEPPTAALVAALLILGAWLKLRRTHPGI